MNVPVRVGRIHLVSDGSPDAEHIGEALRQLERLESTTELPSVLLDETACIVVPLGAIDSGLPLVRRIRLAWSHAAIVVYSSSAPREAQVAALAAGAQDVIIPRTDSAELIARSITRAIDRHHSQLPKATQAAREWIHDRFMDAQALAKVGSWEVDVPTWTVEWSPEFRRIMGIGAIEPPPELEGYGGLVHVDDRERVLTELLALFQQGQPFESEHRVVHANGEEVHVVAIGRAQTNSDGQVTRAFGTTQDVTARKLVELKLGELVTELQAALEEVKVLRGFIPICMHCKRIRDVEGYWTQLESYLRRHTEAEFSHGLCPACVKEHYGELGGLEIDP